MPALLVLFVALLVVAAGVRVVGERERCAVIRLGRFLGVRGPGLVLLLPVIDRGRRIVLDRDVPQWRSLTAQQLAAEIEHRLATSGLPG